MKWCGKIYRIFKKERIISLEVQHRLEYFHLSSKNMKDFKFYLLQMPYVTLVTKGDRVFRDFVKCFEVHHFEKIMLPAGRRFKIFYDIFSIREAFKKLLNRHENRLFLDLEFSLMSPLSRTGSEIVQYGFVLENDAGEVLLKDASFVLPRNPKALNIKTLMFLSRTLSDFSNAVIYSDFYNLIKGIIAAYNPRVYAWGENDILMLEQSFRLNKVEPLDIRKRYVNLMRVIKNYYSQHHEHGLFKTYEELTQSETTVQSHDAFEDARVERQIFHIFQKLIN